MIDAEHLGSHSAYTNDKNPEEVRVMVLKDRRVTTAEMPQTVNVSKWSVYWIMCDSFGFHKSCTRWVPRQLTEDIKCFCRDMCCNFWSVIATKERTSCIASSWGWNLARSLWTGEQMTDDAVETELFLFPRNLDCGLQHKVSCQWCFGITKYLSVNINHKCGTGVWWQYQVHSILTCCKMNCDLPYTH